MFRQLGAQILGIAALLLLAGCNEAAPRSEESAPSELLTGNGLGFYTSETLKNPRISALAGSVVKLVVPAGPLQPVETITRQRPVHLPTLYQRIQDDRTHEPVLRDLLALQVSACIRDQVSDCRVRVNFAQSSGFVTGDGQEITTAFHSVLRALKNAVPSAEAASLTVDRIKELDLPVLVYNHQGRLLSERRHRIRVARMSHKAVELVAAEDTKTLNPVHDFAVLSTEKYMGTPLKRADSFHKGDGVFIAGYPMKTEDRASHQAADSDGKRLHFTRGGLIAVEKAYEIMGKDWNEVPESLRTLWSTTALAIKADGVHGMSGGPVLNGNGEYIGIFTSSHDETARKVSFGLSILGF